VFISAGGLEQAQLHPLGYLAEQDEIGARAVIGGAQRVRLAWPHFRLTRFGPTGLQLVGGMTAGAGFIFELTGVAKEIVLTCDGLNHNAAASVAALYP
jgi:hypothetical protein